MKNYGDAALLMTFNALSRRPLSIDHLSHQIQEHLYDVRRVGKVRKDSVASDNEITEEIEQNSLSPGRILAPLPVGCDDLEGTSIEDLLKLGQ